jgi:hypothetical protein
MLQIQIVQVQLLQCVERPTVKLALPLRLPRETGTSITSQPVGECPGASGLEDTGSTGFPAVQS